MKISYMLRREDFYEINKNTLKLFYRSSKSEKRLYIYPELNAIVTARPSKAVRRYLYTEFRITGSAVKRLLVRLYAMVLLNSGGLLASKSLKIKSDADNDTLIYPCNKKYRVFDFKKNRVYVLAKDGFPGEGISNEISFRKKNSAEFIPGILYSDDSGYAETIIDGCPVARTGERMQLLSDRAYDIWSEYVLPYTQMIPVTEYAKVLENKITQLKVCLREKQKAIDFESLDTLCGLLLCVLQAGNTEVPVSLSHGDLQPGNIWVENVTNKIYIIDWESEGRRSIWYDKATLYEGLRRSDGIAEYAKCPDMIHATVLLEDVIFRLEELMALPGNYGSRDVNAYLRVLQEGFANV